MLKEKNERERQELAVLLRAAIDALDQ